LRYPRQRPEALEGPDVTHEISGPSDCEPLRLAARALP